MKHTFRCIFVSCSAILLISCAEAQKLRLSVEHVYFGIGPSTITGQSSSYNNRLGGHAGFQLHILDFGKYFSFRTDVNGSLQGGNYTDNSVSGQVQLIYLSLPLLLRFQSPGGFFAEIGMQPGYLLSANDKYAGTSNNYKDYVKSFDLGLPIGVGYEFKKMLVIGVRAIPGLTNINMNDPENLKDHNLLAVFRLSYRFH
jgi:hypothetical protein